VFHLFLAVTMQTLTADMCTVHESTVLSSDNEVSASNRICYIAILSRALKSNEHLGDLVDVNFLANIVAAVAEDGTCLDVGRPVALAVNLTKRAADRESYRLVCRSYVVAGALLAGKHCHMLGLSEVERLAARCDLGHVQTTRPVDHKLQLVVEPTLGEGLLLIPVVMTVNLTVWRGVGFVDITLLNCVEGACRTAESGVAQNCVTATGCLEPVATQSTLLRRSIAGGPMLLFFQKERHSTSGTTGPGGIMVRFVRYEDRADESIAEETNATAAVNRESMFSVADNLRLFEYRAGSIATAIYVEAGVPAQPPEWVVDTASVTLTYMCKRVPRAGSSRYLFDTKFERLRDFVRPMLACAHGATDPVSSVFSRGAATQPALKGVYPGLLRSALSYTIDARYPRGPVVRSEHSEDPLPRVYTSADSCFAWEVQYSFVGGRAAACTSAALMVTHPGTAADTAGGVLSSPSWQGAAGLITRERRAAQFINKEVYCPAALKSQGKRPGVDRLQRCDSHIGKYLMTTARATSIRLVVRPDRELSRQASQPSLAWRLCHDAWTLTGPVTKCNEHSLIVRGTATRDRMVVDNNDVAAPAAESTNPLCVLRSCMEAADPVSAGTAIPNQSVMATPRHEGVRTAVTSLLCLVGIEELSKLATVVMFAVGSMLRPCWCPVQPLSLAVDNAHQRRVAAKLLPLLWLLCGIAVVGGRSDVDLATWTKPGQGLEVWGAEANDYTGVRVAGAGDVNKDGYQDILVGANSAGRPGKQSAGAVYLVFGSPGRSTNIIDTATTIVPEGLKIWGAAAGDNWGSVSGAGDINTDGIDDFLVGGSRFSPPSRTWAGAAVVMFGKTSGWADIDLASFTSGSAGFWIWGAAAGDNCGFSVGSAGDVNGDGSDDLIVGCHAASPLSRLGAGTSYVVFGHTTAFTTMDLSAFSTGTVGFRIFGPADSDHTGASVSGGGDLNGDGYGDIIIGANLYDGTGDRTDCGAAYVIFGHSAATAFTDIDLTALSSSQGFRITGAMANDRLGGSVSRAGDFNHDGYGDIIVGSETSKAVVIFGHSNLTAYPNVDLGSLAAGTVGFIVSANDYQGWSVGGGVDINRDGVDDVVIAAASAYTSSYAVYVLYGRWQFVFTGINLVSGLSSVVDGSAVRWVPKVHHRSGMQFRRRFCQRGQRNVHPPGRHPRHHRRSHSRGRQSNPHCLKQLRL
jgi:hypothetical protein